MIDLDYIGSMYPNVVRIWKAVTTNTGEEYAILYYSLEWFFFSSLFAAMMISNVLTTCFVTHCASNIPL